MSFRNEQSVPTLILGAHKAEFRHIEPEFKRLMEAGDEKTK